MAACGTSRPVQIQLRIIADDDSVISEDEILQLDKGDDRLEAIGLSRGAAKAVLAGAQERVVTAQAASFLARQQRCALCRRCRLSKGLCRILFRTAFGTIPLVRPRLHRCRCQPSVNQTFSPLTALFTAHTAPELLYLETKWASLVSDGRTTDLLQDVLPSGAAANVSTIRRNLHRVAARREAALGSEPPSGIPGGITGGQPLPVPPGSIIVGLDGGYVRNWHDKKHPFEVMVGKAVPEQRDHRYFGLVRSPDHEPKRRLGEVRRAQGLPVNQAVTMRTDGGDSVRGLVGELSPGAAHDLAWFHLALRLTGLGQYAQGLTHHAPVAAVALQSRLERIKGRLWHGDAGEALTRAEQIAEAVAARDSGYSSMKRFATAAAGLATYIANNADAITNHSTRWHNGERISTAFVEATVTVVVSRRFCHGRQRHPGRGSRRSGLIISHSLACSHLREFSGHPEEVALFGKNGPSPRATARNLPRPSKLSHSKDFEPPDGYIRHHLA